MSNGERRRRKLFNWLPIALTATLAIVGGVFVYGQLTERVNTVANAQTTDRKKVDGMTVAIQTQSVEQAVMKQEIQHMRTEQQEFRVEVRDSLREIVRKIDRNNRRNR